jgi:hypothetical protein
MLGSDGVGLRPPRFNYITSFNAGAKAPFHFRAAIHHAKAWCFHPYSYFYTSPWSSMALATLRKPPMLAPFTKLPGVPYISAVS